LYRHQAELLTETFSRGGQIEHVKTLGVLDVLVQILISAGTDVNTPGEI